MKTIVLLIAILIPSFTFAEPDAVAFAESTYAQIESYNDMDATNMTIAVLSGDALAATLAQSKECGSDKMNDMMYYAPMDAVEDVGFVYSQPAASLITRLQEKSLIMAEQFNALSFDLNKSTNDLMTSLEGKSLNVCVDYSTPAFSDGQTVYFVMADGKVEFAVSVGRPD